MRRALTLLAGLLGCAACTPAANFTAGTEVALPPAPPGLSAVWANEGGDKVWQQELRASSGTNVRNVVWDGKQVSLRAAGNEVVSFVLQLESASGADGVSVDFHELRGPGGARIATRGTASGADLYRYVDRNIEGFYIRYLKISGIGRENFGYAAYYDERHVPKAMRRPLKAPDSRFATGDWHDRPMADKSVPDIAVPLELVPTFAISPGNTQAVWFDVYVPRDAPAGTWQGSAKIRVAGQAPRAVPVQLTVYGFTLPDRPAARTLAMAGLGEILERYTGTNYAGNDDPRTATAFAALNNHFRLFKRHKISFMPDNCDSSDTCPNDRPAPGFSGKLDGSFYSRANGYDGPGLATGDDIFVIGAYGGWHSAGIHDAAGMQDYLHKWQDWFERHSPGTERFLYLIDESKDYGLINRQLDWALAGGAAAIGRIPVMLTMGFVDAAAHVARADIIAANYAVADTAPNQQAVRSLLARPGRQLWQYNGGRPASGSFQLEDDGVALRMLPWAAHKLGIRRWFYWNTTYYKDFQAGGGRQTDVFNDAVTFGTNAKADPLFGHVGYNRSNGDGVLVYPGTDAKYPKESYGVPGPFASLRLKEWRRGVQDIDYVALAEAVDPVAAQRIVATLVPRVLWEVGVEEHDDPSFRYADISWPTDPDIWELARSRLAAIIERGSAGH